jgi:hypothetical protein
MTSGQYDQQYLDYLRALLESMGKAGLVAYVVSSLFLACDTKAQTDSQSTKTSGPGTQEE